MTPRMGGQDFKDTTNGTYRAIRRAFVAVLRCQIRALAMRPETEWPGMRLIELVAFGARFGKGSVRYLVRF
jgi:hypothetical protein